MAIQLRRGSASDFDGSKLLEGECAIALDTGAFYYKGDDTVYQMATAQTIGLSNLIEVTTPTFSSLPQTFRANGITAQHRLIQDGYAFVCNANGDSTNSSLGSDWKITPGDNTVTISGTFSGSTAVKVVATMAVMTAITATTS